VAALLAVSAVCAAGACWPSACSAQSRSTLTPARAAERAAAPSMGPQAPPGGVGATVGAVRSVPPRAAEIPAAPERAVSPPTAAAPAPAAAPEPELAPEPAPPRRCLLGDFCFGPVLTLGVLDVLGIGVHARSDHFGVNVDFQFIHFSTQGIPITLTLFTVEGRVYPFADTFFLAAGVAWQHAGLTARVVYRGDSQVPPFATEVRGAVNVPVLKLGLGFMGRSGFILGTDLAFGVQLGGNTVEFSTDLPRIPEVIAAEDKVRRRADAWVRAIPFLLQFNVIRVGFLF